MKAKKRYGQNFLNNESIINKIILELDVDSDDLILEIGPGRGALTKRLVELNANVCAFEIDTDMTNYLSKINCENLNVVYADFLEANILKYINNYKYNKLYIVGNLPYYITTPIIEKIIQANINFEKMLIMVQKEVAERFMAVPGNRDYGFFTVYLNCFYNINHVIDADKYSFNPVPKVDSTVISLVPHNKNLNVDIRKFKDFLKECFLLKRKKLKNNLSKYDWNKIKSILEANNYNENVRAEELKLDVFIEIFNNINK